MIVGVRYSLHPWHIETNDSTWLGSLIANALAAVDTHRQCQHCGRHSINGRIRRRTSDAIRVVLCCGDISEVRCLSGTILVATAALRLPNSTIESPHE